MAACMAFALLLGGCASKTRAAQFYRLQALSVAEARQQADERPGPGLLGVGPVEMPAYLDRPQIVTGGPGAQLQLDEFHRWAEPLRDTLTQVLAEDLALLLPASHVLAFPWNRAIVPDYQVEIQIARFHVDAAGNSELKANWSILKGGKPVLMRAFQAQTPVGGDGWEAKVAAQSRSLAAFSKAIAQGLLGLSPAR